MNIICSNPSMQAMLGFNMEAQNSERERIIEVREDVPAIETSLSRTKICRDGSCGFLNDKSSSKDAQGRFALRCVLMSVEVVGKGGANIAILTDAAHLLTDVAAFAISLFSVWASGWEATPRQSYGFYRIEILGALVSDPDETHNHGITVTTHHSYHHEVHCNHDGKHRHIVETAEPLLKHSCEGEKKPKQNVQGAYLLVLGDSIQSIGVMIGGAIIWYKPECNRVLDHNPDVEEHFGCSDASTAREIDATKIEKDLCEVDEVVDIHELHIWAITVGKVLMACHVIVKPDANADMVLEEIINYIKREYNISHVTIQVDCQ
ncbi:Metal tolerance A2 -like protein [Pyrus ussuriensis x Pyrus communis]|uniref:Metal tolerance A2-like protein n=1 Tax=Pyrus ussuriensis x Pyrus communis TaxID=2448454 RepID=A0A5N5GWH3_9ROSA|nr:Metal tolerance A2 -like protein [Pyrus ussuriensis x Pyrus communis]